MGNSQTKPSRGSDPHAPAHVHARNTHASSASSSQARSARSGSVAGRPDGRPAPVTRRERDEQRLQKELLSREAERARSIATEHVDGGYLVTMGTYHLSEDFNKAVVRRLIIERLLAPFWRGLNDHDESWTEHQLVAAAKGLAIPAADEPPPKELQLPAPSTSADSARARSFSSPTIDPLVTATRDRSRTVGSTSNTSPSGSATPTEISLPDDVTVSGQRLEAVLYRNVEDCPICFLAFPPFLNRTRCCNQLICSECFVNIRRADPHLPDHADPSETSSGDEPQLISEPTTCPYCQEVELGVWYKPPPFRRGLAYAQVPRSLKPEPEETAVEDEPLPLGSITNNKQPRPKGTVVTSDHIRPDWQRKLQAARMKVAHQSATASAIHTMAMMMEDPARANDPSLARLRRATNRGQREEGMMDRLLLDIAIARSLNEARNNGTAEEPNGTRD